MGWFLRVVELDGGRWACRFGRQEFDVHVELDDALAHITALAGDHQPAELFVHYLDGTVGRLGAV